MIPKTIHRVWIGPPEPDWVRECGATWAPLHPEWEIVQWDEAAIETLMPLTNQELWDQAPTIFPRHVEQFRSDVVRLEILWQYGGVYVDADMEARRSLDEVVTPDVGCWMARQDREWVNNAIVGAAPFHPFIGRLINEMPASVERRDQRRMNRPAAVSGPRFVTRQLRSWSGTMVKVYPAAMFYPYRFTELDRADDSHEGAVTVHHWHNRRKERGVPR